MDNLEKLETLGIQNTGRHLKKSKILKNKKNKNSASFRTKGTRFFSFFKLCINFVFLYIRKYNFLRRQIKITFFWRKKQVFIYARSMVYVY